MSDHTSNPLLGRLLRFTESQRPDSYQPGAKPQVSNPSDLWKAGQVAEKARIWAFRWKRRASALRNSLQNQGALAPGHSSFDPENTSSTPSESPIHRFKTNTPTAYASDEPGAATHPFPPVTGAEDKTAILLPQGPIPTPDDYSPRRIPHLGHALAFVVNTGVILVLAQAVFLALAPSVRNPHTGAHMIPTTLAPKQLLASMAIAYIVTLLEAWSFFPLLWHRSFAEGIRWDFATARRNAYRLIPLGLILGWTVQAISSLIPVPKSIPMDRFFHTRSDVWLITVFGTLLAPLFEEICFRGFLLPAFAIAYDWLSLPKTPIARERWHMTVNITLPAFVFSGILTSIFFALVHAEQLAHAWVALFVLFCVSLVLTWVRVKTASVACSTLVHACYNLSVFISLFIATGGYRHLERMTR